MAETAPRSRLPWRLWILRLLVVAVLLLVFLAYLLPEMVVDLGNRLWSCF
ncbi:hypothetical protein [Sphaerotilus microaerophilus]|jgi:hypothetical protein|uniref:Uncharacterized protein n=1 Tax=Sphaerotilus microaerophilus TaxID=2914710 RepID=A0ABN6PLJ3_9BURK|nr:hypothetical protein [Sphaerotilus sp. FB-5]BDI05408.1 hypothetical protein CATMQ487_23780 [Sphaerotilus sp. FB-5]